MPIESLYKRVLITGAAGYLGGVLRQALRGSGMLVRLTDRSAPSFALDADEEFIAANLASFDDVRSAVKDVDAIVHLGGQAVEAAWDTVLSANIVGTYNLFEAARLAGVRRVVFASSHHAVGFYRRDRRINASVPPRPDSRTCRISLSASDGQRKGAHSASVSRMVRRATRSRIGILEPCPSAMRIRRKP